MAPGDLPVEQLSRHLTVLGLVPPGAIFALSRRWGKMPKPMIAMVQGACIAGGLSGLGTGLTFACLADAVVGAVPPEKTGVATGMNANIRTVGGSVGAAVMTTIVTANVMSTGFPVEDGYAHGFAFLAAAALLAWSSEQSSRDPTRGAQDDVRAPGRTIHNCAESRDS